METRLDQNSLDAYIKILPDLPKKRQMVLQVFIDINKPISAFTVAQVLGVSIHNVVGRINELRFIHQLIVKDGVEIVNSKKRNLYRLRADGELPDGRQPTKLEQIQTLFDKTEIDLMLAKSKQYPEKYFELTEKFFDKIRKILSQ